MDVCRFSDLKPSRDLIDPNFGGYKLSLDALPVYSLKLNSGMSAAPTCLNVTPVVHLLTRKNKSCWDCTKHWLDQNWNIVCKSADHILAVRRNTAPAPSTWSISDPSYFGPVRTMPSDSLWCPPESENSMWCKTLGEPLFWLWPIVTSIPTWVYGYFRPTRVGLKSDGTTGHLAARGSASRYGPSQGDETGDWTDDGIGLLHVIRSRYSIFIGGQTSTLS